jgi:hypothetical protein
MRKINTQDAFKMARLIKHTSIKDVLMKYYEEGKGDFKQADIEKFGMRLFFDVIECVSDGNAEKDFYELLGGICEKQPKEIQNQPIEDTIADLKKIYEENDMKSFFQSVSAMISNISI